jgi:exodeoxyribonuclease V alpha subunit
MQCGALGARSLNADLQKALNPNPSARIEKFGSLFAPGDKIMQTRE